MAVYPRSQPAYYIANSKLILCIQKGDMPTFLTLLDRVEGRDIEDEWDGGLTALHWAARLGRIDMLTCLLPLINTEIEDDQGHTPIFHALETESASEQIIDLLLEHKANVSHRNRNGKTVLRLAAEKYNTTAVKKLVELDLETLFDVVSDCQRGHSTYDKNVTVVRKLVECGANVFVRASISKMNVLHVAADRGCLEVFRIFKNRAELAGQCDVEGWTAIHIAAKHGWEDIVHFLLTQYSSAVDVEAKTDQGRTALHIAAESGHTKVTSILIGEGASVTALSKSRNTPVHIACFSGNDETAFGLLEKMTESDALEASNDDGDTLLWAAAGSGCTQTVQGLLQYYKKQPGMIASVLSELPLGVTVAYHAIANKKKFDTSKTVALLIQHKASTEGLDLDHNTALHWAAINGMTEVVNYLLRDEASKDRVKLKNRLGQTPVQCAAAGLHDNAVGLLLKYQNPERVARENTSGWTGIHWAAKYKRLDIVKLMVARGADTSKVDSGGRTAADIAQRLDDDSIGMFELVEWLTTAERHDLYYSGSPLESLPEPADDPQMIRKSKCSWTHIMDVYAQVAVKKSGISVYSMIYDCGPESIMEVVTRAQRVKAQLKFRWVHLPANNKVWIKDLTRTIYFNRVNRKATGDQRAPSGSQRVTESRNYDRLRTFIDDCLSKDDGSHQLRFTQPFFKNFYVTPESSGGTFQQVYEEPYERQSYSEDSDDPKGWRVALSMPYLSFAKTKTATKFYKHGNSNLHMPLTLDQFYYYSLPGTDDRTTDQVLFRHQKSAEEKNRTICMIDQLWLYIVDDETIVTSCSQKMDESSIDIEEIISKHFIEKDKRPLVLSTCAMIPLILGLCIRKAIDCELGESKDRLLQVFGSAIATAANREVGFFDEFNKSLAGQLPNDRTRGNSTLLKEIELLKEIKDILDELNIIKTVFLKQKYIMDEVLRFLADNGMRFGNTKVIDYYRTLSSLDTTDREVDKMIRDAKQTQENINHLLDLQQKHANLSEAISTKRQGQTIMVFTVVTIVFLPITFLSSLFALDVTSFPHNDSGDVSYNPGWVYSRLFGITVAVSVPLVILAFFVNQVGDFLSKIPNWFPNLFIVFDRRKASRKTHPGTEGHDVATTTSKRRRVFAGAFRRPSSKWAENRAREENYP